jgi:serine protease Do
MRRNWNVFMAVTAIVLAASLAAQARSQEPAPQPPAAGSGFLGGKFAPINDDVAEELGIEAQDGVVAIEVIADSPAEKAGIKEKDILKKIDENVIDTVDKFRSVMAATKPGQLLRITILRDKQEEIIAVTLGTRPPGFGTTQPATKPG